jgi:glycosyltransferase involved in cell wall biosynthesis
MKVLCLMAYYLPGFKSGGPTRTLAHMAAHLREQIEFHIIASDRDQGDTAPYSNVPIDRWTRWDGVDVFYASPTTLATSSLAALIRDTPHDVLYLNSFFDPVFTVRPLLARRLGKLPRKPAVIAPRGEFSAGAYAIKAWKKRPYVALTRTLGLYSGLTWQASSEYERDDIRRVMREPAGNIVVAPDLPPLPTEAKPNERGRKAGTPLRLCFLSRISPKKNLDFALDVLHHVQTPVIFDIYGPREDGAYWQRCEALMRTLPKHHMINYCGAVEHERVAAVFGDYDLFFFPTRGENFGHVILESMLAGTPVLLADTTPWRQLETLGVGWDLPLDDRQAFANAIETAAARGLEDYAAWRTRVRAYARQRQTDLSVVAANHRLFMQFATTTSQ